MITWSNNLKSSQEIDLWSALSAQKLRTVELQEDGIDYNKPTLIKELNRECKNQDCKDFSFIAISGTVLRDKILELVKLSSELKTSLKQAKNKK